MLAKTPGVRYTRSVVGFSLLSYIQTSYNAFFFVTLQPWSDRKDKDQLFTAQDTDRLSKVLYRHGGASYLQVLTSENNAFAAELNLAQAQLIERLALVQLYVSLGGGWE